MLAVELRPEERRGPLQNFIRPPQLTHFLLKLPHPARFHGAHAGDVTVVDISLLDPCPHGLDPISELGRDSLDRPVLGLKRPGFRAGSDSTEGWGHGSTEEVSERVA